MGKTSRKLTIVVFLPLDEWSEIQKLEEQGHIIIRLDHGKSHVFPQADIANADIVFGPRCCLMDPAHKKYLPLALKAARLRRYGQPQKRKGKDEEPDSDDLD